MIVTRALLLAWTDLLRPRVLSIVLTGIALTIGLFLALQLGIFWAIRALFSGSIHLPLLGDVVIGPLLSWGSLMLFPVMGFFLMAPVAAAFSGLFAGQVADEVEALHYPQRRGEDPDFWEGLLEALPVMGAVLLVGLVSLMLTPFLGPFAPALFYGANGWLLGREFFQMAARRHLDEDAASALRRARPLSVTLLGVMIAFALTVPIANIAVPVLAAAGFTHLFHLLSGSVDRAA